MGHVQGLMTGGPRDVTNPCDPFVSVRYSQSFRHTDSMYISLETVRPEHFNGATH